MNLTKIRTGVLITILAILLTTVSTHPVAKIEAKQAAQQESKRKQEAGGTYMRESPEDYYAAQLDALPIIQHPGTDHRRDSRPTFASERRCKSTVYKTLKNLPPEATREVKELTLFYSSEGRRGLSGDGNVILRCNNVTIAELVAVLVHEIGHITDSRTLRGKTGSASNFYDFGDPVLLNDPSLAFYQISWINEKKREPGSSESDFVSGYAMSDPFEDFAETYAYYRLHGQEFRSLLEKNAALAAKYNFMRFVVFGGKEFGDNAQTTPVDTQTRNYDVTVLPYKVSAFLDEGV